MEWENAYLEGDYKNQWDSSHPSPELVGFISSRTNKKNDVLLDVGCGTGEDTIFLSNYVNSVHGIDISPTAIIIAQKKAQKRKSKANFKVGSVYALPFSNNMFDIVLDRGCLHNLPLSEWKTYEHEIYRVLKKNGVLFLRGARKVEEYGDNFTFITEQNIKTAFLDKKWEISGPYAYTMFSDAGILYSNLFLLNKITLNKEKK